MRISLPVILAAILLPVPANSSTISFIVSGGELAASFGLNPFEVSDDLRDANFGDIGTATLVSGPLLDLDVDEDNGFTSYRYGGGTLALTLTVDDKNGNPVQGTFLASTSPFSFSVCEGCDTLFGGGLADDFEIDLGDGLFDAAVAKALGISPHTSGGFIDFGLEDIDGGPYDASRTGFDHRGFADLEIETTPVPEPSLLLLGAVAAAGWAARRRRVR